MANLRRRNPLTGRTTKLVDDGTVRWVSKDNLSGAIRFSIATNGDFGTTFTIDLTKQEVIELFGWYRT